MALPIRRLPRAERFLPGLITLVFLLLPGGCRPDGADAPRWLGYAEADYIYVAAPKAGWITTLNAERGAKVTPGQLLFTLDADSEAASHDEAEATIHQAEQQVSAARATLDLARKEYLRQKALLATDSTTKQNFDEARASLATASASLKEAEAVAAKYHASLSDAAYQLSQRRILSRTAGVVQDIYFRPGEYASAATPVVALLPPENVYVRFFVPETDYARLKLGQKVHIHCDGCKPLSATVSFIADSYAYAPPVVFSVESRTKLVYKVEARMKGGVPLHPGQPLDVTAGDPS